MLFFYLMKVTQAKLIKIACLSENQEVLKSNLDQMEKNSHAYRVEYETNSVLLQTQVRNLKNNFTPRE